jgi:hypothetical protein
LDRQTNIHERERESEREREVEIERSFPKKTIDD